MLLGSPGGIHGGGVDRTWAPPGSLQSLRTPFDMGRVPARATRDFRPCPRPAATACVKSRAAFRSHEGGAGRSSRIVPEKRPPAGDPRFLVRWTDTGQESLLFPATAHTWWPPSTPRATSSAAEWKRTASRRVFMCPTSPGAPVSACPDVMSGRHGEQGRGRIAHPRVVAGQDGTSHGLDSHRSGPGRQAAVPLARLGQALVRTYFRR